MSKKKSEFNEFLEILRELKKAFPTTPISNHISSAIDGDIWGTSDQELVYQLKKYAALQDFDHTPKIDDVDVEKLWEQSKDLDHLFDDDQDEDAWLDSLSM